MKSSNVDQCLWMLVSGLEPAKITFWASTYSPSTQARVTSQKSPSSQNWLAVTDGPFYHGCIWFWFTGNLLGSTILIMSLLLGCTLAPSPTISKTCRTCFPLPSLTSCRPKVFLWTDYTSMSTLSFPNLLLRRLAPASSSSSLFRSSTSQDEDLGPVELARFGSVLPGWEFSFSWGFQLPSQSKTDWGSSEIALSFIVFFQPAKDFNSRPTVHLQPRTGKVVQKVGPASGKIVLKKRAAVVVAALLNVFSTHVQFSKNIGK